jgi:hypothetical protein
MMALGKQSPIRPMTSKRFIAYIKDTRLGFRSSHWEIVLLA